jgi:hypothetical protein
MKFGMFRVGLGGILWALGEAAILIDYGLAERIH